MLRSHLGLEPRSHSRIPPFVQYGDSNDDGVVSVKLRSRNVATRPFSLTNDISESDSWSGSIGYFSGEKELTGAARFSG